MANNLENQLTISFAQNYEDILIDIILGEPTQGFYIDVGANDPDIDSVTKRFYKRGWTGINIEPNPEVFKRIALRRKKDTNLNVGIAKKSGKLSFCQFDEAHGLSTFLPDVAKKVAAKSHTISVDTLPLKDVIKKHAPVDTRIDFIKIDVEGFEHEVLSSFNIKKVNAKLLIVEISHIESEWHTLIAQAGYQLVFNDGLNEYFAAEDFFMTAHQNLKKYPEVMLERKPVVSLRSWQVVERDNVALRKDNRILQRRIKEYEDQVRRLTKENNKQHIRAESFGTELHRIHTHPIRFAAGQVKDRVRRKK